MALSPMTIPLSGHLTSLSILSMPTSRLRMCATIMSPAVSTLSPSLADTLYQEVKPSSWDNLYTSSSVTLLWSVRSLLLANNIVGIYKKYYNWNTFLWNPKPTTYLCSICCYNFTIKILLPLPDSLEGCSPSEIKDNKGCGCVSKEDLQLLCYSETLPCPSTDNILESCSRTSPGQQCPTAGDGLSCLHCSLLPK